MKMATKRKHDERENDKTTRFYGDGNLWHRTRSTIRNGSYGPIHRAILKKPKFRQTRDLPVSMAVKSAQVSNAALIRKELAVFNNLSDCPFICQCFGEESTTSDSSRVIHNLLLECSYYNLGDMIRDSNGRGLAETEVRRFTRHILEGISCVHSRGYVHCDLKPEILMIFCPNSDDKDEVVAKIGDFALAKWAKEKKKIRLSSYTRKNLRYLSPEVVGDKVQEGPADIWAVGCIVIEMLTGKSMWDGKEDSEVEEILLKISKGNEAVKLPSEVSEEAKGFLKCCLDRKDSCRLSAAMLLNHPFVAAGDSKEPENKGI